MRKLALELATAQKFFELGFTLLNVSNRRPVSKVQPGTAGNPTGHTSNSKGIRLQADPDGRTPFLTSLER
jgi:hypothetical protein